MTQLVVINATTLDDDRATFSWDGGCLYIKDAETQDLDDGKFILNKNEARQLHAWLGECLNCIDRKE